MQLRPKLPHRLSQYQSDTRSRGRRVRTSSSTTASCWRSVSTGAVAAAPCGWVSVLGICDKISKVFGPYHKVGTNTYLAVRAHGERITGRLAVVGACGCNFGKYTTARPTRKRPCLAHKEQSHALVKRKRRVPRTYGNGGSDMIGEPRRVNGIK